MKKKKKDSRALTPVRSRTLRIKKYNKKWNSQTLSVKLSKTCFIYTYTHSQALTFYYDIEFATNEGFNQV